MTCLKSLSKSVVEQIVYHNPTPCLTTKPGSPLLFLPCFIFFFHFSLFLSSSLMSSSLPSSPCKLKHMVWVPAASLCPLICHGSPFAPSITPTALTVVDHHSNSTGVVRMNVKEISYCDCSWGKMCVQMGSGALGEPWAGFLVCAVDRIQHGRLARSCSSRVKPMQLIPTWCSFDSFFSMFSLQHCSLCLCCASRPMPGTAGECNLWSTEDHLGGQGLPWSRAQTSHAVMWASRPHATPMNIMHGREKRVGREESKGSAYCSCYARLLKWSEMTILGDL